METAAVLRSVHGAILTSRHSERLMEKPGLARASNIAVKSNSFSQVSVLGQSQKGSFLPCLKVTKTSSTLTSDAVSSDKGSKGPVDKKSMLNSTLPNGFEALILEVCDETSVAELKLKIGDFEMHLRRDVGYSNASTPTTPPIISPTTAPPVPSEPMNESGPATPSVASQKSSPATTGTFESFSNSKASKLAALEASGADAYALVSSPTVGTFQRGRTLKGKKQPPSCKEGDIIKEGQIVGFLDQFGNELPVRSEVAGEVLKILYKDGEPVGYGDPLIAVLPSFHGIK